MWIGMGSRANKETLLRKSQKNKGSISLFTEILLIFFSVFRMLSSFAMLNDTVTSLKLSQIRKHETRIFITSTRRNFQHRDTFHRFSFRFLFVLLKSLSPFGPRARRISLATTSGSSFFPVL